jgi:hypothetical protein
MVPCFTDVSMYVVAIPNHACICSIFYGNRGPYDIQISYDRKVLSIIIYYFDLSLSIMYSMGKRNSGTAIKFVTN